jgi:hypothetical protein
MREYLKERSALDQFYIFSVLFIIMALFGYSGPAISPYLAGKARREKVQDLILGFIVGAANAYLRRERFGGFCMRQTTDSRQTFHKIFRRKHCRTFPASGEFGCQILKWPGLPRPFCPRPG